jgi:hypothetical protein
MYPQVTQFETRRWQVERELQLLREREGAKRMQSPERPTLPRIFRGWLLADSA